MIEVSNCVICEGEIRRLKRALVAPFAAKRIWNRTPFCVDLVQCEDCKFTFYSPRPDDVTYRISVKVIVPMRFATEPWDIRSFNDDLASLSPMK
jgi:hypothetical protein